MTAAPTPVVLRLPAAAFARGWASVALAASRDPELIALDRTVCVEAHPRGALLVATDRHLLLHAWVPLVGDPWSAPPDVVSAPASTWIAVDPHGRARGLAAYLLKVAGADDDDGGSGETVTLTLGVAEPDDDDPDGQGVLTGLDREWVVIEHPNHERLRLATVGVAYPAWRIPLAKFKARKTGNLAVSPEILGRLGRLGRLHATAPLLWRLGGSEGLSLLEVGGASPAVGGAIMPIRWGWDDAADDAKGRLKL